MRYRVSLFPGDVYWLHVHEFAPKNNGAALYLWNGAADFSYEFPDAAPADRFLGQVVANELGWVAQLRAGAEPPKRERWNMFHDRHRVKKQLTVEQSAKWCGHWVVVFGAHKHYARDVGPPRVFYAHHAPLTGDGFYCSRFSPDPRDIPVEDMTPIPNDAAASGAFFALQDVVCSG